MNVTSFKPAEKLSAFVKAYLIIETTDRQINRVFPDTSLVMSFRLKGLVSYVDGDNTQLDTTVITGLRKSGRLINYSENTTNLLVIFKEASAYPFIKEPVHELVDSSVSIKDLQNYKDIIEVEERLYDAKSNQQRIAIVEEFLLSKLYNHKADKLVLAALDRINTTHGTTRIKDLADILSLSQDAFEKRFRRIVGMSAKQFSGTVRMRHILTNGVMHNNMAEVAFHAGYFDQPHFNKDFKTFTGLTPKEFIKSPLFW